MKFLLDTCTFLWLIKDSEQLSQRVRSYAKDSESEFFLSTASALEIAIKYNKGKLPLPQSPKDFVREQRSLLGAISLPIEEEAALHIANLPKLHEDPFDRILVAQSIVHGLTLLTPDPLIKDYGCSVEW